ncbi:hypothetical protein GCM10023205_04850 [Yinghuangia aomiensis]|uniref:Uncharacterized protein n=1 Tax=Yinghuangia aomiensis TaxID=676205 RepID=A0ABP9GMJ9_9ACTN
MPVVRVALVQRVQEVERVGVDPDAEFLVGFAHRALLRRLIFEVAGGNMPLERAERGGGRAQTQQDVAAVVGDDEVDADD